MASWEIRVLGGTLLSGGLCLTLERRLEGRFGVLD